MRLRLTSQDRERITRFRVLFNSVEQAVRRRFGNRREYITKLADRLKAIHPEWKYRDDLRALAHLRNEIAHTEGTDEIRAVPTESALTELSRILRSVAWLDSVGHRFARKVEYVRSEDSLREVLKLIRLRDYSHFPVIDRAKVRGLLTENGITRWLAENAQEVDVRQRVDEVRVADLLREDEHRTAYQIVPVAMTVERAIDIMSAEPTLEALLITDNARAPVPLKGIITRWDILQIVGAERRAQSLAPR